jgi:hypothetical protein
VERKIGWGGKLFIRALCCLRNVWPTKSLVSFVQESKLHWFGTVYGRSPVRPPGSTSPTRQLSGKPREHGGVSAFKLDHYWREVDCIAVPLPNVIARVSTLRAKNGGQYHRVVWPARRKVELRSLSTCAEGRQPLAQRPSKHRVAGWTRTGQDRARARLPIRPVKAQFPAKQRGSPALLFSGLGPRYRKRPPPFAETPGSCQAKSEPCGTKSAYRLGVGLDLPPPSNSEHGCDICLRRSSAANHLA